MDLQGRNSVFSTQGVGGAAHEREGGLHIHEGQDEEPGDAVVEPGRQGRHSVMPVAG